MRPRQGLHVELPRHGNRDTLHERGDHPLCLPHQAAGCELGVRRGRCCRNSRWILRQGTGDDCFVYGSKSEQALKIDREEYLAVAIAVRATAAVLVATTLA